MDRSVLTERIMKWKQEKNAAIVAHNYQIDEVQDIADRVGDSFSLSKYCAATSCDLIVFCGVHFMAESAKILSPEKTVLLPEKDAGCPMADMVTAESLREKKKEHPGCPVVCYINSSAEVKAESDICCTSSNAIKVIQSLPETDILFVPDQNLGHYVQSFLPEKRIILWDGYCITHHRVRREAVERAKALHPDAAVLVHPECRPEVTALADFVGSTSQIIDMAGKIPNDTVIIGTEMGVLHKLKKDNPGKTFYLLSPSFICPNMKKTTLQSVHDALAGHRHVIEVEEAVRNKAVRCLNRMLEVV